MSWTEERVALLSKLWAEGLSASQIANQLGGVTRNAVIGKVHRLGLSGRAKSPGTARAKKPRDTSSRTADRSKAATPQRPSTPKTMGANALAFEAEIAAEAAIAPQPKSDVVVPISKRASILTLTEQTCKWPIGDPGDKDFHFCGNQVKESTPYCSYHCSIAYQPVSERRQKRKSA